LVAPLEQRRVEQLETTAVEWHSDLERRSTALITKVGARSTTNSGGEIGHKGQVDDIQGRLRTEVAKPLLVGTLALIRGLVVEGQSV
jgi:hypothetical protein